MIRFPMKKCFLTILLSLGFPGILLAQDLGARAQLTFFDNQIEDVHSTAFQQIYELRFQKRVTPSLQYRLVLRWEDDITQIKEEDKKNKLDTQFLQPTFDILFQSSPFELRLGLELNRNKFKLSPGEDHLFEQKKFFSSFTWNPEGLPSFSFLLDRKANEDKKLSLDSVETNLTTNLDYTYKAFRFLHSFQFYQTEDKAISLTKQDYSNLGRIDYTDNFLNNRINITGGYLIDYRKRVELLKGGGGSISTINELIPQKGLYSNDPTPSDDSDFPLGDTPALIDRNLTASTGINIGTPGGLSSQNIGVNLGRVLSVDQIYIGVRNSAGGFVPFGGSIPWDVYSSSDGINWTAVAIGASTFFNPTFSRYEISFPPASAQFFKVVNLAVNATETLVTEIQIFNHITFTSDLKRVTTAFNQTGNLTTSVKPIEKVTLTYDGYINTTKNDLENISFTSTEWTQGVTALLEPFRFLSAILRYQKHMLTQSEGQDQESDFYSAVLNFYFLKNLDTSFSVTQGNEKINGDKSTENWTLLLHNAAKLYKNWDVSLDLQYQQQKSYVLEQASADTYTISIINFAQLTKNLSWTLNGVVNWRKISLADLIEERTQDVNTYTEFYYRPSQQLNLKARWGYVQSREQSGFTQLYRFDWMPFPDGAFQFTGTYELGRDPAIKSSADRYSGLLRWNINRYTYLEFNYIYTVLKTIQTIRSQTFSTTFNLNF